MRHPILVAASLIDEALKDVADVSPTFMATDDKATAMRELVALETRVLELRLRVLADAEDVAESTAARDVAGWVSAQTRLRPEDARGELKLAHALDRRWSVLATGVREGRVNAAQARVIVRCLEDLPDEVPAEIIERAESYIHGFIAHRYPVPITSATWVAVLKPHADILWRWFAQQARLVASFDPDGLRETIEFLKQIRDGKIDLAGVTPVDLITDASPSRFRSHEVVYTEPYVRGA